MDIKLDKNEIDDISDYICLFAEQRKIYYLWRPYLKDRKDDMFLVLAVESESDNIITYNKRDVEGIKKFGISTIKPKEFLKEIGEKI